MATKHLYLSLRWGGVGEWVCGLMRKTSFLFKSSLFSVVLYFSLFWNTFWADDVMWFILPSFCNLSFGWKKKKKLTNILFLNVLLPFYMQSDEKLTHHDLTGFTFLVFSILSLWISLCKCICYLTCRLNRKLISVWMCCSEGPAGLLWKHLPLIWHGVKALMNAAPRFLKNATFHLVLPLCFQKRHLL